MKSAQPTAKDLLECWQDAPLVNRFRRMHSKTKRKIRINTIYYNKRFESENQHDDFFLYLFGIMFFLMFYSQYGYYKKQGDWAQELCAPHPYWYIFFGVCLWIAAFGIILKKCLE